MSHSAKTIVICSDGTGNSYSGMESNVLRLYSFALKECSEQIAWDLSLHKFGSVHVREEL